VLKRYGINRSMRKDISDRPKIGWIGLGKMGTPMSKNLLKAGHQLAVYELIEEATKQLVGHDARLRIHRRPWLPRP